MKEWIYCLMLSGLTSRLPDIATSQQLVVIGCSSLEKDGRGEKGCVFLERGLAYIVYSVYSKTCLYKVVPISPLRVERVLCVCLCL